jgi:hypothetical protein
MSYELHVRKEAKNIYNVFLNWVKNESESLLAIMSMAARDVLELFCCMREDELNGTMVVY